MRTICYIPAYRRRPPCVQRPHGAGTTTLRCRLASSPSTTASLTVERRCGPRLGPRSCGGDVAGRATPGHRSAAASRVHTDVIRLRTCTTASAAAARMSIATSTSATAGYGEKISVLESSWSHPRPHYGAPTPAMTPPPPEPPPRAASLKFLVGTLVHASRRSPSPGSTQGRTMRMTQVVTGGIRERKEVHATADIMRAVKPVAAGSLYLAYNAPTRQLGVSTPRSGLGQRWRRARPPSLNGLQVSVAYRAQQRYETFKKTLITAIRRQQLASSKSGKANDVDGGLAPGNSRRNHRHDGDADHPSSRRGRSMLGGGLRRAARRRSGKGSRPLLRAVVHRVARRRAMRRELRRHRLSSVAVETNVALNTRTAALSAVWAEELRAAPSRGSRPMRSDRRTAVDDRA